MIDKQLLNSVLADLVLLHSESLPAVCYTAYTTSALLYHPRLQLTASSTDLAMPCADMNVRLVLVLGVRLQMDGLLAARGVVPQYVDGYRVTDMEVMTAAAEATGAARVEVEAALSKVRQGFQVLPPRVRVDVSGVTLQGSKQDVASQPWSAALVT